MHKFIKLIKLKMEKKNINHGLSILKTILAFYVVKCHCLMNNSFKNKIFIYIIVRNRAIHVPSFFIMSFYFNYKCFLCKDPKRKYNRLERLLIPYIFWPIIIFLFNNYIINSLKIHIKYTFKQLIFQFIIGRGIINPMWFQIDLIALTFLFIVIIYVFKQSYLFLLHLLMLLSYIFQYSNYYYYVFGNLKNDFQITLNRGIMMIPFAVTGITLATLDIINYLKNYKFRTFIYSFIIFIFFDYFNVFTNSSDYNGIKLNILSLCIIFNFSIFPYKNVKNKYIHLFIEYMTKYTAGIYYLHTIVYLYLRNYILCIRKGTLAGVLLNYIFCYSFCQMGMTIFGNTKAKNLFS